MLIFMQGAPLNKHLWARPDDEPIVASPISLKLLDIPTTCVLFSPVSYLEAQHKAAAAADVEAKCDGF